MADHSTIEWTDATWNVITGCSVVSAGCKHCYAMKLAGTRLRNHPSRAGLTTSTAAGPVWNGLVRFNANWLTQPLRWSPRLIFPCAHGDLFHEGVQDRWIAAVFAIMAATPQHTYQVLTKRAQRLLDWFRLIHGAESDTLHEALKVVLGYNHPLRPAINLTQWPLPNVHIGVSAEHQDAWDERVPLLRQVPAAVRWVSAEPLLGPIEDDMHGLHWVVAGGESGHGSRPMHPAWVRRLRDRCSDAHVPFFFKQWGDWAPVLDFEPDAVPRGPRRFVQSRRRVIDAEMVRAGKKLAGRRLDGFEHNSKPREF